MKARTEEFLYYLLWTCETITNPTYRSVTDSFESWAYRNGIHRQIMDLEQRKLLEFQHPGKSPALECAIRLTETGRLHVLGGRDPEACWNRPWDGQWRTVSFDIPNRQAHVRDRLRRALRKKAFGRLQNSTWISPHPLESEKNQLTGAPIDTRALILMEGRPCGGESDEEIVAAAWNFTRIAEAYDDHRAILDRRPKNPIRTADDAEGFRRWAAAERSAWDDALSLDPLLPEPLLPRNYPGRSAWKRRIRILSRAGAQMRRFTPPSDP